VIEQASTFERGLCYVDGDAFLTWLGPDFGVHAKGQPLCFSAHPVFHAPVL